MTHISCEWTITSKGEKLHRIHQGDNVLSKSVGDLLKLAE